MELIDKSAIVAEIAKRIENCAKQREDMLNAQCYALADDASARMGELNCIQDFLDTLEVKEVKEYEQPEYSYFETIYQCGKKPHWNIGDTLAYYEFYSDREGEYVLGKVTKVDFDKEQCDWLYTFKGGKVYDEQSLLEEETYKKN